MRLKALLHVHTRDDPEDRLSYSLYDIIDRCEARQFDVVALTCHNKVIQNSRYREYAEKHNIILLTGIERNIEGRHVIMLNVDSTAENITTFAELGVYKASHPEMCVIAPHPYITFWRSLRSRLITYHDLFDALEIHWFYSPHYNPNKKTELVARTYGIPVVGSSDVHTLKDMFTTYTIIDVAERSISCIIHAIKKGAVEVVTHPQRFYVLILYFLTGVLRSLWRSRR